MSGGRILQIGTPQEIYEPAERRALRSPISSARPTSSRRPRIGERRFRLASGIELETAEPGAAGDNRDAGDPAGNARSSSRPDGAALAATVRADRL